MASLTDASARNLVIRSLREVRRQFRKSDTVGEQVERELDRLIKRKTRINATSLKTVTKLYNEYIKLTDAIQVPLGDAIYAATNV